MTWPFNENGMQVDHDRAHEVEDRAYESADQSNARQAASEWDQKRATLANMRDHGGDFFGRLGIAAQYADAENYEKLKTAFPESFAKYAAIKQPAANEAN